MIRSLAFVLGGVFLLVGLFGFEPRIKADGHLFGVFQVDTARNLFYLAVGLAAVGTSLTTERVALTFLPALGALYGLVVLWGFIWNGDRTSVLQDAVAGTVSSDGQRLIIAAVALTIGLGAGILRFTPFGKNDRSTVRERIGSYVP